MAGLPKHGLLEWAAACKVGGTASRFPHFLKFFFFDLRASIGGVLHLRLATQAVVSSDSESEFGWAGLARGPRCVHRMRQCSDWVVDEPALPTVSVCM
ncbi:hypothetical protein P3T76_007673 [Phytophthora citrophthora]|uniref:Uncharacterized protein n=1 Tax=Phytophthora citrophthora TaxID=4793 RepID=A0AAD9GLX8_9STRA|nr:hypothetical protein P3T76_007673 [Phytophthora citrophthora]